MYAYMTGNIRALDAIRVGPLGEEYLYYLKEA